MKLIRVWLPFVLGSAMLAGQLSQALTSQKPTQSTAAKPSTRKPVMPTAHHATRRRHSRAAVRKGRKRPEHRPEYADNTVEVINGSSTSKVVFHNDQDATTPAKSLPAQKGVPPPMKVEVVNGTSRDTQYFYSNGQAQTGTRNEPVVVAIQSSDTRVAGGNKHPVVTGVTSTSANDSKTVQSGGQPVTKGVWPRPRRPAYQQDAH